MKPALALLYAVFILVAVGSVSAGKVGVEVYSYDWEASGEASNYADGGGGDWSRSTGDMSARSGSYYAYFDGSKSADLTYTYSSTQDGSSYSYCILDSYLFIESGWDNNDYLCMDYSTDGTNFNQDSGISSDALCAEGNAAGEENQWILAQYNFTSPTSTLKWRWRADSGATAEDGASDDINLTCYTYVPDWTDNLDVNETSISAGESITFNATGTDSGGESDNYYLTVCDTNSITEGFPGTCNGGGTACTSSSTSSGSTASCSNTTEGDFTTTTYYGFICDNDGCNPSSTSVTVNVKTAPSWSTNLNANESVTDDNENVNFTGTGTSGDGDDYYLTVCLNNTINVGDPGTCETGKSACTSPAVAEDSEANCTYNVGADYNSTTFYGFLCNSLGCSASTSKTTYPTDELPGATFLYATALNTVGEGKSLSSRPSLTFVSIGGVDGSGNLSLSAPPSERASLVLTHSSYTTFYWWLWSTITSSSNVDLGVMMRQ